MQIKTKVTILFPGPVLEVGARVPDLSRLFQPPLSTPCCLHISPCALHPITDTAPETNALIRKGGLAVPLALYCGLMITQIELAE